jgi:hypothetical protein
MKTRVYTKFLNITSFALNVCVKYNQWKMASKIIDFRKKHIAQPLRKELNYRTQKPLIVNIL